MPAPAPSSAPSFGAPDADPAGGGRVVFGAGCVERIGAWLDRVAPRRFLLVTDPGVIRAGAVERVLEGAGRRVAAVFDGVPQDSGLTVVEAAVAAALRAGAEGVISVGGGSVLDTGKGVALALGLGRAPADLLGFRLPPGRPAFHAALPTTAGTGSEATDIVVLKDERTGLKAYIGDRRAIPALAILDPALTCSLPAAITAATAMDVLAHAVEAIASPAADAPVDDRARRAIRLVDGHLPRALSSPGNLDARGALLAAAHRSVRALATARVGVAHALGHPLTARHGVPHGLVNGILLPHVVRWNAAVPAARCRYAALTPALGCAPAGADAAAAAAALADRLAALHAAGGLPTTLAACGVPADAAGACAPVALADVVMRYNPRQPTGPAELVDLYRAAGVGGPARG
ncbi:MAG: iron-containing alcohol dehydrogenase family protein [Planctomycetaceae bacterium]